MPVGERLARRAAGLRGALIQDALRVLQTAQWPEEVRVDHELRVVHIAVAQRMRQAPVARLLGSCANGFVVTSQFFCFKPQN